jgi:predicted Zn-ribbon and HTH transcriptional regulator
METKMPNASDTLKLYRTIHKSRASNIEDASQLVIEYFTAHGYPDVVILESATNPLGHFNFICGAEPRPVEYVESERQATAVAVKSRATVETLTCEKCGNEFSRELVRGRKPRFCPECVGTPTADAPTVNPTPTESGEPEPATESFTCTECWNTFSRPLQRGRKPSVCPSCRGRN